MRIWGETWEYGEKRENMNRNMRIWGENKRIWGENKRIWIETWEYEE